MKATGNSERIDTINPNILLFKKDILTWCLHRERKRERVVVSVRVVEGRCQVVVVA